MPDSALPVGRMLTLMDRYKTDVEIKGGIVNFAPHRIIITSNYSPQDLYPSALAVTMAAFCRRISETVQMGEYNPLGFERVINTNCKCPNCEICK